MEQTRLSRIADDLIEYFSGDFGAQDDVREAFRNGDLDFFRETLEQIRDIIEEDIEYINELS